MNRQDFLEAVNWPQVAAEIAEHRSDLELRIAQIDAEVRAGVRRLNVKTQEQRARWQANSDAIDDLAALIAPAGERRAVLYRSSRRSNETPRRPAVNASGDGGPPRFQRPPAAGRLLG